MIVSANARLLTILTISIFCCIPILLELNVLFRNADLSESSYGNLEPHEEGKAAGNNPAPGYPIEPIVEDSTSENNHDWCSRIAGKRYLKDLATTWTVKCTPARHRTDEDKEEKKSMMVCFQVQVEEQPDNFCVGRNVVYNNASIVDFEKVTKGRKSKGKHKNIGRKANIALQDVDTTNQHVELPRLNTPANTGYIQARYSHKKLPDNPNKTWSISCDLQPEWSYGVQKINDWQIYYKETGPRAQLSGFSLNTTIRAPDYTKCKDSIMIIKLEGNGNIWHTLMEIWAAVLTIDALRRADDARQALGFVGSDKGVWDEGNFKVYIMEGMDKEIDASPVLDLWRMVSGTPPINGTELKNGCYKSVILPLAGGGNPFWKDHWKERHCEESSLLTGFVAKVFKFYDLDLAKIEEVNQKSKLVRVRIVVRTHNRIILKLDDLLEMLRAIFQGATFELIYWERMTTKQQLEVAQETDVLIGATGAGLTHTMFLRKGAAIVELTQPEPFEYFGFANVAKMLGIHYFRVNGMERNLERVNGWWQSHDLLIDEQVLIRTVGDAIESQMKLSRR